MVGQIPNYQKLMKPVLEFYQDGQEHELNQAVKHVADLLDLTADQRALRTSSGQAVIHNRVSWAHTYLRHAGLIENARRGVNVITDRGKDVLAQNPAEIDNKFLAQFEEFRDFKGNVRSGAAEAPAGGVSEESSTESDTPEERMAQALMEHNQALSDELLTTLRKVEPTYFEKIVGDLLDVMGYGSVTVTQRTNDGGIDAIVNEDKLGLSKIYVQAKRYAADNRVNGKEIRDFVGALEMNGVNKGVFITTSYFHSRVLDDLRSTQKSIVLVDGRRLAELMIEYDLGVTTEQSYKLKRLDSDYLNGD